MNRDKREKRPSASPYALESILSEPLTDVRIRAIDCLNNGSFPLETLARFAGELTLKNRFHPNFPDEVVNAFEALRHGVGPRPPDVSTPETQLLWFMTLSCMQINLDMLKNGWGDKADKIEDISQLPVWQQLQDTTSAKRELAEIVSRVSRERRNPNVRIDWEKPGQWFFYNPEENYIGVDLLLALAGGFEHTRAVLSHEFFHSQYTVRFSDREQELEEELEPYNEKIRDHKKLTPDEYRRMRFLQEEFALRHELTDKVENCVVNRAAANSSFTHYQDYFYSLNNTLLTICGFGKGAQERLEKFAPVAHGMTADFTESAEGGSPAAEKPEKSNPKGKKKSPARKHFENIQQMINLVFFSNNYLFSNRDIDWQIMGVDTGLLRARPLGAPLPERDAAGSSHPDFLWLRERASALELMQPRPADRMRGAASFNLKIDIAADERMAVANQIWDRFVAQDAVDLLAEAKDKIEQQLQKALQNGGEGDGDDNDNEGQGKPQKGGGKGKKGGQPGDDGEEETVEVEGAGSMPSRKVPKTPGKKGDGKPGPEQKDKSRKQPGKSLDELLDEIKKAGQKKKAKNGQKAGAGGEGPTLEEMAKGDWEDYAAMKAAAAPLIAYVTSILTVVRRQQVEAEIERSEDLTLLPEDNELDRLELEAHRNFIIKDASGQTIEDQDRNRFSRDHNIYVPTLVDLLLLIDGSGSMDYGGGATPLKVALFTSMIFYEAGKAAGMNVTVGMWGSKNPLILARPGDNQITVQENFLKAAQGLKSGTDMRPSVPAGIEVFATQKNAVADNAGFTHVMYFSDGDIDDRPEAETAIKLVLDLVPYTTFDCGIIQDSNTTTSTKMEDMFRSLIKAKGDRRLGVVAESDRNKLPIMIVQNLVNRMIRNQSFMAVPFAERQQAFRRALQVLKEKPPEQQSYELNDGDYLIAPRNGLTPG